MYFILIANCLWIGCVVCGTVPIIAIIDQTIYTLKVGPAPLAKDPSEYL